MKSMKTTQDYKLLKYSEIDGKHKAVFSITALESITTFTV